MRSDKKGLSDLVSNVLIILLVFASIAIMGVIILNLVKISGQSIENTAACKQINVKPVGCIHNITDANLLFATEYESGVVLSEVDTVTLFTDGSSANQTVLGAILGNFETQSIRESNGDNNYDKFYTVTKFKDTKGIDRTCVSDTIGCTLYNPTGLTANDNDPDNGEVYSNGGVSLVKPSTSGSGGSGPSSGDTPVNGLCGSTLNACTAGSLNNIADNSTHYLWQCTGQNTGSTASCSLPNSGPSEIILLTPTSVEASIDYVECSSICYNHSYAGFVPDHRQHDIRVYPYKIVNGVKHFSSNGYTSYFDVTGTNLFEDTQFPDYNYNIHWSWSAVANADGYRILKWDTAEGRVFDHYFDTTSTSFVDGDSSMFWTYGNSVTPIYISGTGVVSSMGSPTSVTVAFAPTNGNFSLTWNDNADDDVGTNIKLTSCTSYQGNDCMTACGISSNYQINVSSNSAQTTGTGPRSVSYSYPNSAFGNCDDYASSVTFQLKAYNNNNQESTLQTINTNLGHPYSYFLSILGSPSLIIDGPNSYGAIRITSPIAELDQPVTLTLGSLPAGISVIGVSTQSCTPNYQSGSNMQCGMSFFFKANSSASLGSSSVTITATSANTANKMINLPIFTATH